MKVYSCCINPTTMGRITHIFILIWIDILFVTAVRKDICEKCVSIENCPMFANMNKQQKQMWLEQVPCDVSQYGGGSSIYGFSSIAKGDYVCCPNSNIWGIEHGHGKGSNKNLPQESIRPNDNNGAGNIQNPSNQNLNLNPRPQGNYGNQIKPIDQTIYGNQPLRPGNQNNYNLGISQPEGTDQNIYNNEGSRPNLPQESIRPNDNNGAGNIQNPSNQNLNLNLRPQGNYGNQIKPIDQTLYGNQPLRPGNQNNYNSGISQPEVIDQNIYNNQGSRPNIQNPYGQQINPGDYDNPQGQPDGQDIYGNPQTSLNNHGIYDQQNPNSQYPNNGINIAGRPNQGFQNNQYPSPQNPNQSGETPGRIHNQNPYYQGPNAYPQQQQQTPYLNNGNGNSFNGFNPEQQCAVRSSLPPDPATGCCGKDMSDSDRITDLQSILNIYAAPPVQKRPQQKWPQQNYPNTSYYPQRGKRSVENSTAEVVLDNRIAGGKETELDQFPWTVLLKVSFDYGSKQASFNCGGSLISQKYVLTAGHCVFEAGANIIDIEITLAEYDKRTFPRDCKSPMGGGKKCIDNIIMHAEDVIHHPQYDDDRLHNDIALIRLHGYAPYTRYIRSICLPPVDIDNPDFSNLPLAVAGWGRNGEYVTDIKQSTVVHLIPHDECQKSYPHLTRTHLCAAGRTGEDTCKGDSGGPLMMLYRGSYYVIGIVSGKRADSPCGTSVPSLYTNVFQYVQWINSNISN